MQNSILHKFVGTVAFVHVQCNLAHSDRAMQGNNGACTNVARKLFMEVCHTAAGGVTLLLCEGSLDGTLRFSQGVQFTRRSPIVGSRQCFSAVRNRSNIAVSVSRFEDDEPN